MGICVPRHIICDNFDPGFTPTQTSTLPLVGVATKARAGGYTSGNQDASPTGGAAWRSTGLGQDSNTITVDIIWENINRFSGFEFSNPPSVFDVGTDTSYVEMTVRVEVNINGSLAETFSGSFQTAEWVGVNTDMDPGPDEVQLCWNCTQNTTDTSDVISSSLRPDINNNSIVVELPEMDAETVVDPGPPIVTWDASLHDGDHIGPSNATILADGAAIDSAASGGSPYLAQTITFSGASLPNPGSQSGPFFSLIFASQAEDDDGSLSDGDIFYWGQTNALDCYSLTWLPFDNQSIDCGLPIVSFDNAQNAFIVDDTVASQISSDDILVVFGSEIEDASSSVPTGSYNAFRTTFTVVSATEPGNGTTEVVIDESLPNLHSRFQAAGSICPSSTCV